MLRPLRHFRIRSRRLRQISVLRQKLSDHHSSRLSGPATKSSSLWRNRASTRESSCSQMRTAQEMSKTSTWQDREQMTWLSSALTSSSSPCLSLKTPTRNQKMEASSDRSSMWESFMQTSYRMMKISNSQNYSESKAPNRVFLSWWNESGRRNSRSALSANACSMCHLDLKSVWAFSVRLFPLKNLIFRKLTR